MFTHFSRKIRPYVETELNLARQQQRLGNPTAAFAHLENAHVLGQASTYLHLKVHILMLHWAIINRQPREALGQILRSLGALGKTWIGLVPKGNTGGSNVSPFRTMPVTQEHAAIIARANGQTRH